MNFSLLNVGLLAAGALLIASAIKDKTPRQIIAENVGAARTDANKPRPNLNTPEFDEGQRGAYGNDGLDRGTPAVPYKVTST